MASIGPSDPIKDLMFYANNCIKTAGPPKGYQEKVSGLVADIMYQISSSKDASNSIELLTRVSVELGPQVDKIRQFVAENGVNPSASETVSDLEALSDFTLGQAKYRFLEGQLTNEADIPLVKYLIEHSPIDSPIYPTFTPSDLADLRRSKEIIKEFMNKFNNKGKKAVLSALIQKNPDFFVAHFSNLVNGLHPDVTVEILASVKKTSPKTLKRISEASDHGRHMVEQAELPSFMRS